jgi:uncharacterized protein YkwD
MIMEVSKMKKMNTLKKIFIITISVVMTLVFSIYGNLSLFQKTNSNSLSASAESSLEELADEVTAILNEFRVENGLNPLETIPLLQENAMTRAQELTVKFSHDRPDGSSCFTAIDKSLKSVSTTWGENVAYGQKTPEEVMDTWENSEAHRSNMLDSKFTHVGIGVYCQNGVYYWVQLFLSSGSSFDGEYVAGDSTNTSVGTYKGNANLAAGTGDVNSDGKINSIDAVMVLKYYAAILVGNSYTINTSKADVNTDGTVNAIDAVDILCYYAKSLIS